MLSLNLPGPGMITDAKLCCPPGFIRPSRSRGAKAAGRRYERRVQDILSSSFNPWYLPSPWFAYREQGEARTRYCQPDGLLILPHCRKVVIVEVKLRHTIDAFRQLYEKYLPVVATFFGYDLWDLALCEVVKWFDVAEPFPVQPKLRPGVDLAEPGDVTVWICKGR